MLFVVGSQMYERNDVVFASYGLLLVIAMSNAAWTTLLTRRKLSKFKIDLGRRGTLGSLLMHDRRSRYSTKTNGRPVSRHDFGFEIEPQPAAPLALVP
jgi:hypothetical protein